MYMRKIKMIWDFRGPAAEQTAKHHVIHLKEYIVTEELPYKDLVESKVISDMQSVAYMIVDEKDVAVTRAALKPHRGEVYEGGGL